MSRRRPRASRRDWLRACARRRAGPCGLSSAAMSGRLAFCPLDGGSEEFVGVFGGWPAHASSSAIRARRVLICPSSSLFCASSWSTSGFKLSLSSEFSVSGGIPSLISPARRDQRRGPESNRRRGVSSYKDSMFVRMPGSRCALGRLRSRLLYRRCQGNRTEPMRTSQRNLHYQLLRSGISASGWR